MTRIGVYVLLSGIAFDLAAHYFWQVEYLFPGIRIWSLFLFITGTLLLIASYLQQKRESGFFKTSRVSLTAPGPQTRGLIVGPASATVHSQEPYKIHTPSWLLRMTGTAIVLCAAGILLYSGFRYWLSTRTFTALDVPISLKPGHIRTPSFNINLRGLYYIGIGPDHRFPEDPKCQSAGSDSVLKTHLILYRDGRELGQAEGLPYYGITSFFDADKKGNYSLDIHVLSDASCLDSRHPRLTVWTPSDYSALQFSVECLSGLLILCGLSLLAHSAVAWTKSKLPSASTAAIAISDTGCRIAFTHKPLRRLSALPAFGLFGAFVIVFAGLVPLLYTRFAFVRIPKGLRVSLLNTAPSTTGNDRWSTPIVIRLEDTGPASSPKLFLNSKPVSWGNLPGELKAELARCPEWVVYVEGDDNLAYQYVTSVIDIARGEHAKVILLTPKSEKLLPAH
jgi:biopolymer transport protein ExbD